MSTFDLVVLGCGGGPSEDNLSSYFLKAADSAWSDGIVSVDAGSGIGALARILEAQPYLFGQRDAANGGQPFSAAEIMSWVRSYLITHAHMDHINGLVLSAGSINGPARQVYAVRRALQDIEGVFSDRLWPKLAAWHGHETTDASLILTPLNVDGQYAGIRNNLSVRTLPLSHGSTRTGETYDSAAFFIRHNISGKELLFLGDVEPDSLSARPRTGEVWRAAAPKMPHSLSAIFIECSYPAGRADNLLYGHLSPEHVVAELIILAEEVVKARRSAANSPEPEGTPDVPHARKRQRVNPVSAPERRDALKGVRVYIIHCKEDFSQHWDRPIQQVITEQVRKLCQDAELGADIHTVEQGMAIHI